MKPSVVLVVDNYPPRVGGAELLYAQLAKGLIEKGYNVAVVTTGGEGLSAREKAADIDIHRLTGSRYWFFFAAFWYLVRHFRQVDLVQTATYSAAIPASLFASIFKKPVFLIVHEVLGEIWFRGTSWWRGAIHWFLERLVLRFSYTCFVAVSEFTAGRLASIGIKRERIRVIYNGVAVQRPKRDRREVRQAYGIEDSDYLYLYYGRLGISKGIPQLIEAVRQLFPTDAALHLGMVVGEQEETKLKQQVLALQQVFGEQVILIDRLDQLALTELIAASDTVVVPSLSEGFGLAAAEACALGRPLVVSDGGALPEVVWGEVVFFHAGETDSLVKAMQRARRGEFGKLAPRQQFNWQITVEAYDQLYQEYR